MIESWALASTNSIMSAFGDIARTAVVGNPPDAYDGSNSWDNATGDYVTFTFTGVQIKFYGVLNTLHGIGAVSLDGGSETMIDYYSAKRLADQLMWTSPMLPAGTHTFKLRVTGTKIPAALSTL